MENLDISYVGAVKRECFRFLNWKVKTKNPSPGSLEFTDIKILADSLEDGGWTHHALIIFPDDGIGQLIRNELRGHTFTQCIFSKSNIQNFTFSNCSFFECSFNGALITGSSFHKCEFHECSFFKVKFRDTYVDPATFKFSPKWHWDYSNVNVGLFQDLYRNSKNMHQEFFAMEADKRFQFYKRYEYLRGDSPQVRKFFSNMFFDVLLGYGYGISNALVGTLIIIFAFAFIIKDHIKNNIPFIKAFYFAVVSLTTTGYGDIYPRYEEISLVITTVFLLFSMVWCAVLTAIIVKRIVK